MMHIEARPDGVAPTDGIVRRIQPDQRQQKQRKPFPHLTDEEEQKEADKPASTEIHHHPAKKKDDGDDSKIDVHVSARAWGLGQLHPTRQTLPTEPPVRTLH